MYWNLLFYLVIIKDNTVMQKYFKNHPHSFTEEEQFIQTFLLSIYFIFISRTVILIEERYSLWSIFLRVSF